MLERRCLTWLVAVALLGTSWMVRADEPITPPDPFPDVCVLAPRDFPIMFVYAPSKTNGAQRRKVGQIKEALANYDQSCFDVTDLSDAIRYFDSRKDISCIVVDWNVLAANETPWSAERFFTYIRKRNPTIPIFLITDDEALSKVDSDIYRLITGYLWTLDDTPIFNAGVIRRASRDYQENILPPMFDALVKFVNRQAFNWAVPGHSGGSGLLRTPAGNAFFKFFGENIFRGDVSTTIGSVGDALLHTGAIGAGEKEAAKTFGADLSYYVLNGTSNTNRIVFSGVMTSGDIALLDRNCHKSVMQGMILTQGKPIYLMPTRNKLGVIGPIKLDEFSPESTRRKLAAAGYPEDAKPRICVVTTPTYDGLLYQYTELKKILAGQVENILFDEAWYAYGKFYPIYSERFAMDDVKGIKDAPTVFAGHSVHKLLAAFSQGSILHVKNGASRKVDPERFNQAFLMHCSTSPFTPLLASIDTCVKMMEYPNGHYLVHDLLEASVAFRKKVQEIYLREKARGGWFFKAWQPEKITLKDKDGATRQVDFLDVPDEVLINKPECWTLNPGESWHGFEGLPAGYAMLDPLKVTLVGPGLNMDGSMDETGIPMLIVESYLQQNSVFSEKYGFYLDLILFSPGVTKSKVGTMIARLLDFKNAYDSGAPLSEVLPNLVKDYPEVYANMTLRQLCDQMHDFFKKENLSAVMGGVFDAMPEIAMLPAEAYFKLVRGQTEYVPVSELNGRVTATMVVPYPPGIPILMPGERLTEKTRNIHRFMMFLQDLENKFPSFGLHIHGVKRVKKDGKTIYMVDCVKADCE